MIYTLIGAIIGIEIVLFILCYEAFSKLKKIGNTHTGSLTSQYAKRLQTILWIYTILSIILGVICIWLIVRH